MEKDGTSEEAEAMLFSLFGKKNYSFANPEKMYLCAPKKEFSFTTLKKEVMDAAFKQLPDYLQELFADIPRGLFVDGYGRSYKHEYANVWSVYIPFNVRRVYKSGNIYPKDVIKITHAYRPDLDIVAKVESIGDQKKATFSLILKEGPWMHVVSKLHLKENN